MQSQYVLSRRDSGVDGGRPGGVEPGKAVAELGKVSSWADKGFSMTVVPFP